MGEIRPDGLAEGAANGQLVNVVDVKEYCNFHSASFMRRGLLTIAIGTGGAAPQSQVASVSLPGAAGVGDAKAALGRVVYFDFDSYVVKDEFRALIDAHAKALAAQRGKRLVIEGHTDERGGREYNLALGQKRAEAVAKSLTLLGVPEAQLEAVSFGKERPAVEGSDEEAWARNRRAELKDR